MKDGGTANITESIVFERRQVHWRRGWWIKDELRGQLLLAGRNLHRVIRGSAVWHEGTQIILGTFRPSPPAKKKIPHDISFNFYLLCASVNRFDLLCSFLQLRLVTTTLGSILKVIVPSSSFSLNILRGWSAGSPIYTRQSWCKARHQSPSVSHTCTHRCSQSSFDIYVIDCSNEVPLVCIGLTRQIIVGYLNGWRLPYSFLRHPLR